MIMAAKVMATTGLELLVDPAALAELKKEFKEKTKDYTYKSGIPPDQKPPIPVEKKN